MPAAPRCISALTLCFVMGAVVSPTVAAEGDMSKRRNVEPPPEALAAGRAFFEKGQSYYKAGKYQAAWVEFSSAFQIVELPDLLFNIARCEVQMGRKADAAKHFRQFLAARPSDPEADNIRRQIDELEGRVPASKDAGSSSSTATKIPWISVATGGAGLLLVLGGAGALGAANATYYSLQTSCGTACDPSQVSTGKTQSAVGYSLLAIGFVGMAAAAAVLPFELNKKDATTKLALSISPSGAAILGRF